jgi:transposase
MLAHHLSGGSMRGPDEQTSHLFSYISPEQRVPADHPLRAIRRMTDEALETLSPTFERLYAKMGRPSVAPEKLLRALLLQALYSVRSERLLVEELQYNLLFRWFVGLNMDDAVWTPTTFSKNRDRLLEGDVAAAFFDAVAAQARAAGLLSDEHFTVDGTLLDAWASHKSFRPKHQRPSSPPDDPGNPTVDFRGAPRKNDTHHSTSDPDARLFRKSNGEAARLAYFSHVLLDNRHGLVANVCTTAATGTAEREAALMLLEGQCAGRQHGRRGQGVRRGELRRGRAGARSDAARGAAGSRERDRRSDHAALGLRHQSAEAEARRTGVWVDEDRRPAAEAPPSGWAPGGLGRDLHGRRLQPDTHANPGGDVCLIEASPVALRLPGRRGRQYGSRVVSLSL